MIIYAVSRGQYSDYGIVGLFSNKELAKEFIKLGGGDDIEEYELDQFKSHVRKGFSSFHVQMDKEGNTSNVHINNLEYNLEDRIDLQFEWKNYAYTGKVLLYTNVLASNKEHAVKITNEKRAQLIASGEWEEKEKEAILRKKQSEETESKRRIRRGY